MFPLKQRKLIRGAAAHIKAGLGAAADYEASTGTPYYAPFTGTLSIPYGPNGEGGIWLRLTRTNGDKIEVAHLEKYVKSSGGVTEGELVAYTDNTGTLTSGDHAHIQIIDKNSKRLDPEKYDWGSQTQQGVHMYEKGVTLEMLADVVMRDVPSDIGKPTGTLQKGNLCEVVEHTPDWRWYSINAANVKFGWIKDESNFKAVPRASVPSDDTKKLAQAKQHAAEIIKL